MDGAGTRRIAFFQTNGFAPKLREELMKWFRPLETAECPFGNLPEKKAGRWGAWLTATKMLDCRWLKPVLVGQFGFVEWTSDNHRRHSRFIGFRDKKAKDVVREVESQASGLQTILRAEQVGVIFVR